MQVRKAKNFFPIYSIRWVARIPVILGFLKSRFAHIGNRMSAPAFRIERQPNGPFYKPLHSPSAIRWSMKHDVHSNFFFNNNPVLTTQSCIAILSTNWFRSFDCLICFTNLNAIPLNFFKFIFLFHNLLNPLNAS